MAVINISREEGSYGDEIAEQLAKKLNYNLVEKDEIHRLLSQLSADFSKEIKSITEENAPGFFEQFFHNRAVYHDLMASIIYKIAADDNMIIKGRGGHFLLNSYPEVLNVRIIAPFEMRLERIQKEEHLNPAVVEKYLYNKDKERDDFIHYLYRHDLSDIYMYDLILNTGKLNTSYVVDTIAKSVTLLEQDYPVTDEFKNAMQTNALQCLVEAIIIKELPELTHIEIIAEENGQINITGHVTAEHDKQKAEKIAMGVSGVKSVQNRLIVYNPFQG